MPNLKGDESLLGVQKLKNAVAYSSHVFLGRIVLTTAMPFTIQNAPVSGCVVEAFASSIR